MCGLWADRTYKRRCKSPPSLCGVCGTGNQDWKWRIVAVLLGVPALWRSSPRHCRVLTGTDQKAEPSRHRHYSDETVHVDFGCLPNECENYPFPKVVDKEGTGDRGDGKR
jgi:hypothetical protein